MRLTKTIDKKTIENILIGYDKLNRPIYEEVETYTPIPAEIEHFSSNLADTVLGLTVSANFRCFTYPDVDLKVGDHIRYKDGISTITAVLDYDRHCEILIVKGEL